MPTEVTAYSFQQYEDRTASYMCSLYSY